jgi:NAD(P)-dependent dehydrogenase (short-subunit alcohol dehydrogenase family)
MTIRLDGRVAIVTGAGGGLGRAHAMELARLGAAVVVNDPGFDLRGDDAVEGGQRGLAQRVVDEIVAVGGTAVANTDSVADPQGAARLIRAAVDAYGRLDILVNNAGILRDRSFAKMSLDDFHQVLQVHLMGTVYCTHAAWPIMTEQGFGRIVVTSSPSGVGGSFGQSNYGAAKLGVLGLMNCLALEGAKNGVLINAISPGAVTRMTEALTPPDVARLMTPDLVSPAVAWLCSDRCTQSGLIINALGGYFSRIHYFETTGTQFDPTAPVTVDMVDGAFADFGDLTRQPHPVRPGPLGDFIPRMQTMGLLKEDPA